MNKTPTGLQSSFNLSLKSFKAALIHVKNSYGELKWDHSVCCLQFSVSEDADGSVKDMFCDSYNMILHFHAKCGDVKAFFDYEVAAVMTDEKFTEDTEDEMNESQSQSLLALAKKYL